MYIKTKPAGVSCNDSGTKIPSGFSSHENMALT